MPSNEVYEFAGKIARETDAERDSRISRIFFIIQQALLADWWNSAPRLTPEPCCLASVCAHDPQQYAGRPMGMYHCPDCGEMQIAGLTHSSHALDCQTFWNSPEMQADLKRLVGTSEDLGRSIYDA